MRKALATLLWRALALLSLALGMIGVIVPGLPTVPFLLLAAWAASRGWPALEMWLLNHPRWGESIRNWRERGAMSRKAKWAATLMMAASAALMMLSPMPRGIAVGVLLLMAGVAFWLWRRPEA